MGQGLPNGDAADPEMRCQPFFAEELAAWFILPGEDFISKTKSNTAVKRNDLFVYKVFHEWFPLVSAEKRHFL